MMRVAVIGGGICSRKLEMSQFRKLAITQAAGLNYVILK